MYGWDLVRALRLVDLPDVSPCNSAHNSHSSLYWHQTEALTKAILTIEDRLHELRHLIDRYFIFVIYLYICHGGSLLSPISHCARSSRAEVVFDIAVANQL